MFKNRESTRLKEQGAWGFCLFGSKSKSGQGTLFISCVLVETRGLAKQNYNGLEISIILVGL